MEFFERAHVSKSKTQRKDSKSEENVKKQLKQMLHGYYHSDNALIKDSAKAKIDFEDSSSVSGYSDLNLTTSSNEVDITQGIESSDDKNLSPKHNLTFDESPNSDDVEDNISQSVSIESISEYDEDLRSLSDDASLAKLDSAFKNESEDESDSSFIVTSTDFDSDSNDESEFDADGLLAANIMKKLGENKNKKKKKTNTRKRKLDEIDLADDCSTSDKYKGPFMPKEDNEINILSHDDDDEIDLADDCSTSDKYKGPFMPKEDTEINNLSYDINNLSLPETKQFPGPFRPKDQQSDDNISHESSISSHEPSSPFVSVLATYMETESLTDIFGEYKHPTIRNLPSESQNVIGIETTDLFKLENVSMVDLQTELEDAQDELCSLIPEVDKDPPIEDIELELTELDTSIEPVEESTQENTFQSELTSERELSTDSVDNFLVHPVKVYYGKNNNCIFVMKHPVEIYIHGKVKLKALGGSIEVLGYSPKDEPCEVYATNYNYAQCIKTIENQNAYYGLFGKLTSAGLSVSEAEDIVTSIGDYDGVVSMQPLRSRQMDFVEINFSAADLFRKPSKNIENCFKKVSEVLGCSLYLSRPWRSFEENMIWKQAIDCGIISQSRGIVCGGKGVGKSTFLRYYVNKLLANGPILVVDLDPGQAEFTVAGNLSATVVTQPLLGPSFTHLRTPELMLNIGMINTMDNPRRYANAVETLITHCYTNSHLRNLPWIVNTMGMTNSIGLKLISLIILKLEPTFLLQIDSKNAKKRYDFHLYPQTVKNLYFEDYQIDPLFRNVKEVNLDYTFLISHHSDNGVRSNFSLPPKEERYLNFLAYFGRLLDMRSGDLLSIVPYEVSLKDLKIGLNVKINKAAVTKVINGKVVALCQSPPDGDSVFTLGDTPLPCLGAGLIRGVDWEKEVVYVLTCEPAERLAAARALLYADWAPELRGESAVRPLPAAAPLPYRTAAHYQQRHFTFAPKRRFNPLQLLKMSRTS